MIYDTVLQNNRLIGICNLKLGLSARIEYDYPIESKESSQLYEVLVCPRKRLCTCSLNGFLSDEFIVQETVIPCCPNTRYSYVEYTLYLRRRYTFYVMNVIVPCILLSVLVMVGFCLPPDAGEKERGELWTSLWYPSVPLMATRYLY